METLKDMADKYSDGSPTITSEFGLPYNINRKRGYKIAHSKPEKAWSTHNKALSWYYDALDANLLNSCQWNYNPYNSNEWGDLWNIEDFSIFSRDQQTIDWHSNIDSGGRALPGFCRLHFISVAGVPKKMEFSIKKGTFVFEFMGVASIKALTTIYVPKIQYPTGFDTNVSEGDIKKEEEQYILIKIHKDGFHRVQISRK